LFVHEINIETEFVPVNGKFCEKKMKNNQTAASAHCHRSADLQSAVSRICNLRGVNSSTNAGMIGAADCKSAIRQVANLRYRETHSRFSLRRGWPLLKSGSNFNRRQRRFSI
jgi:hypothetical protein